MRATILGCGEAFDESLANTSVLLSAAGANILFDCGYSVPPQVWKTLPGAEAVDLIYISHPHADHYFGLPALLGRMWEDGRTRPLAILTQPAVIGSIRELLEFGYRGLPSQFQFAIEFLPAAAERPVETHGVVFRFAPTSHPAPNLAVRVECGGAAFCYSGDGMFTPESRRLFSGADVLVHEAFSFEPMASHADIGGVLAMARQEGVRRTALVHVSRSVRRPESVRIRAALEAARDTEATLPEPGAVLEIGTAS